MKEQDFIKSIQTIIGNQYIGDDCAYLKDFGIVVSQDSLVEEVHFKRDWYTPYQLGYKSVAVNISDIFAAGAKPEAVTIGLSLPDNIEKDFVEEFYLGAKDALFGAKIVGGDITGSKNGIFISVTAIGSTTGRNISSRSNAKIGYKVVVKGEHGESAAGLRELLNNGKNSVLINAHLMPKLEYEFSKFISENVKEPYAMMDTSDGLCDALFKIAEASNVKIIVDYNKIPHLFGVNKNDVLFGGEDYKLIAALPSEIAEITDGSTIGEVVEYDGARLEISGKKYFSYDDIKAFNHFSQ